MSLESEIRIEKLSDFLKIFYKELIDKLRVIEDDYFKGRFSSEKEVVQAEQKVIREFISSLIEKKEEFKHVFETETGSIYFVSENGNSWRFKKVRDEYNIQPVLRKIIFIDDKEASRIKELLENSINSEKLIGARLKKYKLKKGLIPFEFCFADQADIEYDESEDELVIKGQRLENGKLDVHFFPGIHMGHKVVKIY